MTASKRVLIIAGPNGAERTVFTTEFLPHEADCPIFINADLIAAGVSPFQPGAAAIRAGKIMLGMVHDQVRQGKSLAFETTLTRRGYVRSIPHWKERGYSIKLFFLRLRTPELAIDRVRQRVKEGGHDVPEPVIRRRFEAGWNNFQKIYKNLVDKIALYDNSWYRPELIAKGEVTLTAEDQEKQKPVKEQRDPDMVGAEAALRRAAVVARCRALATTGWVAVFKDGKIVRDYGPAEPVSEDLE